MDLYDSKEGCEDDWDDAIYRPTSGHQSCPAAGELDALAGIGDLSVVGRSAFVVTCTKDWASR